MRGIRRLDTCQESSDEEEIDEGPPLFPDDEDGFGDDEGDGNHDK